MGRNQGTPCLGLSSDCGSLQGLYQWVYHSHEDAQLARSSQGAPDEDPREDDQPDSGKGQGMGGASVWGHGDVWSSVSPGLHPSQLVPLVL